MMRRKDGQSVAPDRRSCAVHLVLTGRRFLRSGGAPRQGTPRGRVQILRITVPLTALALWYLDTLGKSTLNYAPFCFWNAMSIALKLGGVSE